MTDEQIHAHHCLANALFRWHLWRSAKLVRDLLKASEPDVDQIHGQLEIYLSDFAKYVRGLLGLRSLQLQPIDIANGAFYRSPGDYTRKASDRTYYRANAVGFLRICEETINSLCCPDDVRRASRLLIDLVEDSLVVANHIHEQIFHQGRPFPIFEINVRHEATLYDTAKCLFWPLQGQAVPAVMDPYVSVAILRMAIELRLKRSVGVLGVFDAEIGSLVPCRMDRFLGVYGDFVKRGLIELCIPFCVITRLYRWANMYLHSGIFTYSWMPMYAIKVLGPFFYGRKLKDGFDINSGILVSQDAVTQFRLEFESCLNAPGQKSVPRPW